MNDPTDYPSSDYPSADYPVLPSQEPVGVHRDDNWFDPQGVYGQEYDSTDIVVPQPDPATWWDR